MITIHIQGLSLPRAAGLLCPKRLFRVESCQYLDTSARCLELFQLQVEGSVLLKRLGMQLRRCPIQMQANEVVGTLQ